MEGVEDIPSGLKDAGAGVMEMISDFGGLIR